MARAGGEADKLGNRYEGIWTVDSLLDIFVGNAQSLTIEPLGTDEYLGIEFIKELNDGNNEFHSAKRQTTGHTWSLSKLSSVGINGRSILKDLFDKIAAASGNTACFVSGTTANDLEDLHSLAKRSPDIQNFEERLNMQERLKTQFEKCIVNCTNFTKETYWNYLRRLRVVGMTEGELTKRVEDRIRSHIYCPDGGPFEPAAIRTLLGDAITAWVGRRLTRPDVVGFLSTLGYHERNWQRDPSIHEIVERSNVGYAKNVEAELIGGASIARIEASAAIEMLTGDSQCDVAITGAAGMGKSCVLTQVAHELGMRSIPYLTLRLDLQTSALTSDFFGRELGFPTSPAIVLAGLANGGRCVLIIDQLDALSTVSGRNQNLWRVFEELLAESHQHPQMRVLLSCREFDAENDHRIRQLISDTDHCRKISLALLSLDVVQRAVIGAGVNFDRLSPSDLALLQIPQNLSLFLQSGPAEHGTVGSAQALLDKYWNYKQRRVSLRLGAASRWLDVVRTLADWLSEHQTLSAPRDILDPFNADALAMASEHVLVLESRSCRFFHESVFDYAFARTYVVRGGTVSKLLLDGGAEQHLFRRAQVRQILTYLRDRSFVEYLADLQKILTTPEIRVHIKRLTFDWLRALPDPKIEEWQLAQSLSKHPLFASWWKRVPYGSVPWFDLLQQDRVWETWLRSPDEDLVEHALWLLSQKSIMRHRSKIVAELIGSHLDGSEIWQKRFRRLTRFAKPQHSPEMFGLFLRALRSGWLDPDEDTWWHHLRNLPTENPPIAAELLLEYISRQCARFPAGDPFQAEPASHGFPVEYCEKLAETAPDDFVTKVLPKVAAEVIHPSRITEYDNFCDQIWPYLVLDSDIHDFRSALLHGLMQAMSNLAKQSPRRLRELTGEILDSSSHTLAYLFLSAWGANPQEFANDAAQFLCETSDRLEIGYSVTSGEGGTGRAAITRNIIHAISPYVSDEFYAKLETAILKYRDTFEQKRPAQNGFTQYLLLQGLPSKRLSPVAAARLAELAAKFPTMDFAPPKPSRVYTVSSPISQEAMAKMSDKNWLSAMRKYTTKRRDFYRDFSRGGMRELAFALTREAQGQKERFAALLLQMPRGIETTYFCAILRGLVNTKVEHHDQTPVRPGDLQPLAEDILVAAIRRVTQLPADRCGKTLCDTIQQCSKLKLPEDLIELICHYAVNDPDPAKDYWNEQTGTGECRFRGDPRSLGINSIRGRAALAIGTLLFADAAYWPKVRTAVESLCEDKSIAVRSCAVSCTLALLNIDRDEAVRLFLKLARGAEKALVNGEASNFLYHAIQNHYTQLRPLLLQMLNYVEEKAKEIAARQITLAYFHEAEASEDFGKVMSGDETCRAAAAYVFAYNISSNSVSAVCRERLIVLFSDPSKKVRDEAARCFRRLKDNALSDESILINAYLESPAFEDGDNDLANALYQSTALLPDIVCAIPNKIMDRYESADASRDIYRDCFYLPELVLRVYRQTSNDITRSQCLDTIDRMLKTDLDDIVSELDKVAR
jgi:F0F1-type ATP synthase delta subunit